MSNFENKSLSIHDVTNKYGFNNLGIFCDEPIIKRGEIVWKCDSNKCDYIKSRHLKLSKKRQELVDMIENDSNLKEFIHRHVDMRDDDAYDIPSLIDYSNDMNVCNCGIFNHSCEPNLGFKNGSNNCFQALKDINLGEELTFDYQFQYLEPAAAFLNIKNCKCGMRECRGALNFDQYRNVDWQKRYYKYSCK
jgi:hypothetical protein